MTIDAKALQRRCCKGVAGGLNNASRNSQPLALPLCLSSGIPSPGARLRALHNYAKALYGCPRRDEDALIEAGCVPSGLLGRAE